VFYTLGDGTGGGDGDGLGEAVDFSDKDWLADTNARIAQLYTKDGMDRSEWYNLEERTMSPAHNHTNNNNNNNNNRSSSSSSSSSSAHGGAQPRKLVKDGYLLMKSTGRLGRAVWHRRWFELDEECLSYLKGPETLDEVCDFIL
jgi:hypothetical protein